MGNETTSSTSTSETRNEADPTTETVTTQNDATSGSTTTEPSIDDLKAQVQRMEAALSKANKDGKGHRLQADELGKKLQELETFKAKIDAEKLSDEEKRQLERQNLEKQLAEIQKEKETALRQTQELRVTNEVFKHGQRLNIVDLDAATKLLDSSQIEYDESGNPTNIDALLKDLVKQRSWLTGKQQSQPMSGGPTNPSRSQSSAPPDLSWDVIGKMSREEYAARSAEIQKWILEHPPQYGRSR
jgi:hypothetical protein